MDKDEYILSVRPDLSTLGHTQWFYFQIKNTKSNINYRFHIVNLMKPNCLYAKGMRPLMYSVRDFQNNRKHSFILYPEIAWQRTGSNISFSQNKIEEESKRPLNTLSFSVKFKHDNDTVYFAHCFPYTYSDLQLYIYSLKKDITKSEMFKHSILGKSFGGNYIDMLSVTSKAESPEKLRSRRAIVVSARAHPGETNSSWMMKGFIEFILSLDPQAQYLRDNYIIRVIPMINPGI